jgi:DNA invertase Pin-like site-specific DNA recombinase
MLFPSTPSTIRPAHLERQAFLSVRQSPLFQVRAHTASTARQYALAQRARDLGWPREHSTIIDQDQGHSGASTVGRDGFQSLIAEVGLGRAGAVLNLEVSRFARSSSDWYRLLELCALTDPLVIADEGIDAPGQYNDRFLLGCKGTMREAELHWLRTRLLGGKLAQAQHGALRFRPPAGVVFAPAGQVVLDPEEEVPQAVRLLFTLFAQSGSALAVVKHFAVHHLRCPTRGWGQRQGHELRWAPLTHTRVLEVLHTPPYAGTYVDGRTQTQTRLLPGAAPRVKGHTRRVTRQAWPLVLHDQPPAYLTWDQCHRHQQQ